LLVCVVEPLLALLYGSLRCKLRQSPIEFSWSYNNRQKRIPFAGTVNGAGFEEWRWNVPGTDFTSTLFREDLARLY